MVFFAINCWSRNRQSDNGKNQKQRNSSIPSSESNPRGGETADEDLFKRELGSMYSNEVVGTPIKRLLAEEMSREMESKISSPTIIAKLMGLDGMPSQPHFHRQESRSLENFTKRTVLAGKSQRSAAPSSRRPSRWSSREEQQFKDVYEVLESSKQRVESSLSGNPQITQAEMSFIQQKCMIAQRLSTKGKLRNSKEFHNAIEDLNSNQDLLLRFLEQPDSMFTKRLHELHGASPSSHCDQTSDMKVSRSQECGSNVLLRNIEKGTSKTSRRKPHEDRFSHCHPKLSAQGMVMTSKAKLEGKEESKVLPTRIVVLKPNIGRVQNTAKPISSPCRHAELPSTKIRESDSRGKKKHADDIRPSRYRSGEGESREIAKEVTRKVRNRFSSSITLPVSGFRGYAGDESSSCRSENESENESDVTMVPSKHSFEWTSSYQGSPYRSTESSVSREARKRLSERWKMAHKSVDMGVISRSNTLGEMLAISDRKARPANPDFMVSQGSIDKVRVNDGGTKSVEPLGISSRDGWKDPFIKSLPRSKSVPTSPGGSGHGSPQVASHRRTVYDDSYGAGKEVQFWERNKMVKGNISQGEGSSSRTSRARSRKSRTRRCTYNDEGDSSPEFAFDYNNLQKNASQENPFEQSQLVYGGSDGKSGLLLETESMEVGMSMENVTNASISVNPELKTDMLEKTNSSCNDLQASGSQGQTRPPEKCSTHVNRPEAKPESSASSKETDQPSPVSVLEATFADDLSSTSDCFESLSNDLQGLRMQLKLLKLESEEAYEEGPMLISSDEEAHEDSAAQYSRHKELAESSKELSYIADMLHASSIDDADPNTFIATLHSSDYPVRLPVFKELEKKYCSYTFWSRDERRLLFDQVNHALTVTSLEFRDPYPWTRVQPKMGSRWVKNGLKDGVYKLARSQCKKGSIAAEEQELSGGGSQWLDLGGAIDAIGREMERALLDNLVIELISQFRNVAVINGKDWFPCLEMKQ
ncbi:hypothetical protein LINPERHAP2_LOCUS13280 [Linum perenne]